MCNGSEECDSQACVLNFDVRAGGRAWWVGWKAAATTTTMAEEVELGGRHQQLRRPAQGVSPPPKRAVRAMQRQKSLTRSVSPGSIQVVIFPMP